MSKNIRLPREDAIVGFCGDTALTYPFILQAINYTNMYEKALSRALDFSDVRHSFINVVNQLLHSHSGEMMGELTEELVRAESGEGSGTQFIFGGWSWKLQRFEIFKIHFAPHLNRFTFRPSTTWRGQAPNSIARGKKIAISGDYVTEYRNRLIALLRGRNKLQTGGFDMEPFEILRDMLTEPSFIDRTDGQRGLIGGAPQVMKVYAHPNILPFAVRWEAGIYVLGRKLLDYEKTSYPILDPTKLDVFYPLQNIEN